MSDSRRLTLILALVLIGTLLYLLAPILTPFLIAALLAYAGDPLVDRLERRRFSRGLAVTAVFALLVLVLLIVVVVLVPLVQRQLELLIHKLPAYLDWLRDVALPWLTARFGVDVGGVQQIIAEHWRTAGGTAAKLVASLLQSGAAIANWLANIVLVPLVTFYLLRDWDELVARVHELIPRRWEPTVVRLAHSSDEVLGAFLRGQLSVMLALAGLYSVGLSLIGLEFALLIGITAGLVSFVPYLGLIVGTGLAGVAAAFQFQDVLHLLLVAGVFGFVQMLESFWLTPWLVGDRIGLHPVAVIFAVLAGGQLFGFFGILLALPVAAVVMVLLRYAHERYLQSQLYSD